jgi:hypothetical protein
MNKREWIAIFTIGFSVQKPIQTVKTSIRHGKMSIISQET